MTKDELDEKIAEDRESQYTDNTSNTPVKMKTQEELYDKKTKYILNKRGEVIKKFETLRDKGLVHFGTGSKGEIKAKNIDIKNTDLEELKNLVRRVAYLQTLMSKYKELYNDKDLAKLGKLPIEKELEKVG